MDAPLERSVRLSKEARLEAYYKRRQAELAPLFTESSSREQDAKGDGGVVTKRPRVDSVNLETLSKKDKVSRRPVTASAPSQTVAPPVPGRPVNTPVPSIPKKVTTAGLVGFKPGRKQNATPAKAPTPSTRPVPTRNTADYLEDDDEEEQALEAPTNSAIYRTKPLWYASLDMRTMQQNLHTSLRAKLEQTKENIKYCARGQRNNDMVFPKLRKELHEMLYLHTSGLRTEHWPATVRVSGLLNDKGGLPCIFDPNLSDGVPYPWDIRADAQEVYNKWTSGSFDINILRGINIRMVGNRSADSIDPAAKQPWNYFGGGNLVNGQWWPTQLTTVRDGAHGSAQGGIAGVRGEGAVSIVLAGGYADDRDDGDEIWYTGTEGADGVATQSTMRLVESAGPGTGRANGTSTGAASQSTTKHPVRVLRSHKLGQKSRFAPKKGFRYDGLYEVLGYKVLDPLRQVHLFHLVRLPGQDPIRAVGVEARPTDEEIAAYERIRQVNKDFM